MSALQERAFELLGIRPGVQTESACSAGANLLPMWRIRRLGQEDFRPGEAFFAHQGVQGA